MPKILFLHKGQHAASTRYRALHYFDCLRQAGWTPEDCKVAKSLTSYLFALNQARKADIVVILRKPFKPFFRWLLRRVSKYLVFDHDDAIYVRDDGSAHPKILSQYQKMISLCDAVWAGNDELMKTAEPFAKHQCLIQTTLECEKYILDEQKPRDSVDLVWIGGSSSRPWLENIMPALEQAAKVIPNLRLKIIADFTLQSQQLQVIPVQWSEENEGRELANAHIGIAPLPDTAFTRGKCGLKSLQYMAAGLPVIASPVSVQTEIVQDGITGILADTDHDWLEAITLLAGNPQLRNKMGEAGQLHCQQGYSIQAGCKKMLQDLDHLLKI